MTSRDFCFFLQGFFELNEATGNDHKALTLEQTEMIRRHLNLVFKHEIEPSMNLNEEEKKIHDGTDRGPFDWNEWVKKLAPQTQWPQTIPYTNPGGGTSIPYAPSSPTIYC